MSTDKYNKKKHASSSFSKKVLKNIFRPSKRKGKEGTDGYKQTSLQHPNHTKDKLLNHSDRTFSAQVASNPKEKYENNENNLLRNNHISSKAPSSNNNNNNVPIKQSNSKLLNSPFNIPISIDFHNHDHDHDHHRHTRRQKSMQTTQRKNVKKNANYTSSKSRFNNTLKKYRNLSSLPSKINNNLDAGSSILSLPNNSSYNSNSDYNDNNNDEDEDDSDNDTNLLLRTKSSNNNDMTNDWNSKYTVSNKSSTNIKNTTNSNNNGLFDNLWTLAKKKYDNYKNTHVDTTTNTPPISTAVGATSTKKPTSADLMKNLDNVLSSSSRNIAKPRADTTASTTLIHYDKNSQGIRSITSQSTLNGHSLKKTKNTHLHEGQPPTSKIIDTLGKGSLDLDYFNPKILNNDIITEKLTKNADSNARDLLQSKSHDTSDPIISTISTPVYSIPKTNNINKRNSTSSQLTIESSLNHIPSKVNPISKKFKLFSLSNNDVSTQSNKENVPGINNTDSNDLNPKRRQRSKTVCFGATVPPRNSSSSITTVPAKLSSSYSTSNSKRNSHIVSSPHLEDSKLKMQNTSANNLKNNYRNNGKNIMKLPSDSHSQSHSNSMTPINLNPVAMGMKVLPLPHSALKYSINKVRNSTDIATSLFTPLVLPPRLPSTPTTNNNNNDTNNTNTKTSLNLPSFKPINSNNNSGIDENLDETGNNNNTTIFNDNNNVTSEPTQRLIRNSVMIPRGNDGIKLNDIKFASDKKNSEFHNFFKDTDIQSNEKLITEFTCALSKDILLQGKLYISNKHLAFYSNILGWITTVVISFQEIIQIKKKTTMGIFPNAIVIDTLNSRYTFASFVQRDTIFKLVTNIWNQYIISNRLQNTSQRHSNSIDDNTSMTDYITDDDEYADDDGDDDNFEYTSDTDVSSDYWVKEDVTQLKGSMKQQLDSDTLGPLKHEPTSSNYSPVSDEKLICETNLNAPLSTIFNILFGNDTSYFESILQKAKNFDIQPSPLPKLLPSKKREYVYTKPLTSSIGPSKTKCIITETLDNFDLNDYIQVTQLTSNPDVPSGNSFKTKTVFLLSWDSNNTTKFMAYVSIIWTAKSWIKNAIEKGTVDGVTESTNSMISEIKDVILPRIMKRTRGQSTSISSSKPPMVIPSLPTIGPQRHPETKLPTPLEAGTFVLQNGKINVPMGTTYKLLFGEDISFLKKILLKQNNINISNIPNKFVNEERSYTYIKKLNNSLGPKQTNCNVVESVQHYDLENYILVKQLTKTPDVPSGSTFSVASLIYLTWDKEETSTDINVITNVIWSGKSFLKSAIEKGSIEGQKASMKILVDELNSIIKENQVEIAKLQSGRGKGKRRKSRARKLSTTNKEDVEETPRVKFDFIIEKFKPIVEVINSLTSILGVSFEPASNKNIIIVASVGIFFLFTLFRILLFGGPNSNIMVQNHKSFKLLPNDKIIIDGNEYIYIPRMKTLYSAYEDDLKGHGGNKENNSIDDIMKSSQQNLWHWITDRGDKHGYPYFKKIKKLRGYSQLTRKV
ncbi:Lam4p NDAI_0C01880 [Naumovozyma dairenensis CBS 421]|uniref:VASt domain-containing protein n=1 Tax=Naumovozyma dairenensis (strain ATCC 10597 / BCRC 20456 / CBS 421 / NBRC 0211 / NRRL Y-12639) TaxID=1071378 RepID=G0W7T7_NAUDC|nr:hypothetical protein NDAI_0C01880 [Naumovozyma dairenensis CBS 421]CCD23848.1 hypothetical protein NDAI_0C01880 [Naumovozyma dairenensis CBS 421]